MRKSLLFGAMLLIASCTVQKEEEFEIPSQHRYYAEAEEPVDTETRVYADSKLRVRWNEGDHISIFERKTYNQEFEFLGDTGDTAGDFDPVEGSGYHTGGDIEDGHVYAIYPYDKKNKCDYDGKLTVTFPSVQHYKKDSFGIGANIMVAKTNTMDLMFMHVGGYRTFKLYGAGVSVSSIVIESNGPEFLSGRTDVTLGSDGKPAVSFIESSSNSKSVELVCDTPVALGSSAAEAVEFWFVLPPGTLTQGFTVTITDSDGNEFTKSTSNSIEIKSGAKKSMSAFEVEIASGPNIPVPEAVDLGLPSGVKWASFNLGASAPEEYGDYYAWGETEPKDENNNTYKWSVAWSTTLLTKYCPEEKIDNWYGPGTPDDKCFLDLEDDAAAVNLGGKWRIPTDDEWEELKKHCTFTWTTNFLETGIVGMIVTSKVDGYTDRSIFLPAAGTWNSSDCGSSAYYWSSFLSVGSPSGAWTARFSNSVGKGDNNRSTGCPIRAVYGDFIHVTGVSLSASSLLLETGDHYELIVTTTPANATSSVVRWLSSETSVAIVNENGVVTAVAPGTATITAKTCDGSYTSSVQVTVTSPSLAMPEAVDLGLSVKWATFNMGASKPEQYGGYYAWGETETKDVYSFATYKFCTGGDWWSATFSKYNTIAQNGPVDDKTVLELEDDVANVEWGGTWRMPTREEWTELINNCNWQWTRLNGISGALVIGPNDNNIFLPAGGVGPNPILPPGSCCYWSSSLSTASPCNAWYVGFNSDSGGAMSYYPRDLGLSIRPVSDGGTEHVGEVEGEW